MKYRYAFSVWQVIDERKTVRATFSTETAAKAYRAKLASFKEADHGGFITISELKVYGGISDELY